MAGKKGRSVPLLSIWNVGIYALQIILASGLQIISSQKVENWKKLQKITMNHHKIKAF
jgi:hypothetical protein